MKYKHQNGEMALLIGSNKYTLDELEAMELCYQMHEEEMNKVLRLEVRRQTKKENKPCES